MHSSSVPGVCFAYHRVPKHPGALKLPGLINILKRANQQLLEQPGRLCMHLTPRVKNLAINTTPPECKTALECCRLIQIMMRHAKNNDLQLILC